MNFRFGKTIACSGLIFLFSAMPGQNVPDVPIWNFDKLVHSFAYFWMTCFLYSDLCRSGKWGAVTALCTAMLASASYGGMLELLQRTAFIVNRSGSWTDFSANVLGVLLAVGCIFVLNRNRRLRDLLNKLSISCSRYI